MSTITIEKPPTFSQKYSPPYRFMIYGEKTGDVAMFDLDEMGRIKIVRTKEKGEVEIKLWDKKIVRVDKSPTGKYRIIIYGKAPQRGGGFGFITIGQLSSWDFHIRNPYLDLQFGNDDTRNDVDLLPVVETGIKLLDILNIIPVVFWKQTYLPKLEIHKVKYLEEELSYVDERIIGCPGGTMPRALFYYDMNYPVMSDRWLYALIKSYHVVRNKERKRIKYPKTQEEYDDLMVTIVAGLISYVGRFKYQPDTVILDTKTDGGQNVAIQYEHFSKSVFWFKAGDCEDLAWANSMILTKLQRRKTENALNGLTHDENMELDICTRLMDNYVITNVLCKAQAPELKTGDHVTTEHGLKIQEFEGEAEEIRILKSMSPWHMTCILYPKQEYLHCLGIQDTEPYFSDKSRFKIGKLYAEGTTSIYPDPEKILSISTKNLVQFTKEDNAELHVDSCLLPVANNNPGSSCIFGVMLQHMNDFFIYYRDQKGVEIPRGYYSTIFWVKHNGKVGFSENHPGMKFQLEPQLDLTNNVDKEPLDAEMPLPELDININRFRQELTEFEKRVKEAGNYDKDFFGYFVKQGGIPYPGIQDEDLKVQVKFFKN
jgi:hypothetical protein